jgi:large subunit ribosomal protein L35
MSTIMAGKTKKAFTKRFRVTKNGKVIRRKMGTGHFRAKKSSSTKQSLRNTVSLTSSDKRAMRQEGISLAK